jgi:hypothetical protein
MRQIMEINNVTLDSSRRPTISAGERVLAFMEVQNTFGKHSYYHAASRHIDELADVWVKEDGPYAATAKWTSNSGIIEGMNHIRKFYGDNLMEHLKNLLASTSKIIPEIKNVPENLGVGFGYEMNFLTTPVIEIADDGKTAKGIWYSPGVNIVGSVMEEGKTSMRGDWRMTKYGVDFVKEDGKWKIWHIRIYLDNTPPGWSYENGQAVNEPAGALGTGAPGISAPVGGIEEGHPSSAISDVSLKKNPDPYKSWNPIRAQRIEPKFPEPYYTFSETFSY